MSVLSTEAVHDTVRACLYKDDEMSGRGVAEGQPEPVLVSGVTANFGFHPDRVKTQEPRIRELLGELPVEFNEGYSFLAACNDKDGNQWTSFHKTMDELFVLGMAIGCVEFCALREAWPALPGGMPYLVVTLE